MPEPCVRNNEMATDESCLKDVDMDEFFVPPPPPTAFTANADGSRLIITSIVNENFKSYAGKQVLGPFHKYFTAIIGPNGSGKSNVIDSMLFVFGYRASRLRSKKISALLHDSPDYGKAASCTVTVNFASMIDTPEDLDAYHLVPGSEFSISRTAAADNSSYYTINGKRVQFKEVGELLRKHGIDLDHNRFLILQGEVEQISLMKPKAETEHEIGMLEYLEDIIGSSRFKEPIERLVKRVEEQSELRNEKWNRCKLARSELEDLKAPMEAALRYVQLENTILILNHKLLQKKIAQGEIDSEQKMAAWQDLEVKMKELKAELETKRKEIKELEQTNCIKLKELEKVTALKDKCKAAFEQHKLKDVALQQEMERSNKKRKEIADSLTNEEEKKIKLAKIPSKNEEEIAELEALEPKLEAERKQAEEKHAEVMASLQKDTQHLQDEKETLQIKLTTLCKEVDKTKSRRDVAKTELDIFTSQEENEKKKLQDLNQRFEETINGLKSRREELQGLMESISEKTEQLETKKNEVKKLKEQEVETDNLRRKQQLSVEEARVSMQSSRGRGKVLDSLMQARQSGELPEGVFGRMGDLGAIDAKYDVAISTACGALDNIVVDTVDTAEACIQYLKRNNIGAATFVALDKQEKFRDVYNRPFRSPENVPRLFDLIKVADDRIRPVFYYALHDTLVADNLELASRIAYGKTRYRVVTLAGELIEIAGTMSGGGNQVLRGRMGRKVEQATEITTPKSFEKMERRLGEINRRLSQIRSQIATLEEEIADLSTSLGTANLRKNKLEIEVQNLLRQEPMIKEQLKEQKEKLKTIVLDPAKLSNLKKCLETGESDLEKASAAAKVVQDQVDKLHVEIIAKTKGRLEAAQKKLDDAVTKLDKVRKEKTKLRVAITTSTRNLDKCIQKIENLKKEMESAVETVKRCDREIKTNEEDAKTTLVELEELQKEWETLQEDNGDYKKNLDELLKVENRLKAREIDLKEELSKAKQEVDQRRAKLVADTKKLASIKLTEEPFVDEQPQLKEFTKEELDELDVDKLMRDLKNSEDSLPKTRPNLGAIQEYQKRQEICMERERDLEAATEARNRTREHLDRMRATRLREFITAFQIISQKVKECYQMIAEGGDAEIELVNTMDPFLDGIRFTVRPPKKSWKEIQYLSGGEKTLSSLALIFALHYYKPTPLYFMDEIDAALDWKNTAIVGYYVKEQTKNAQFIIVSLRENMFDLADQLVGIYKTHNSTKSATITPHKYVMLQDTQQEGGTQRETQT